MSPACVVPWFESNGHAAIRFVGCYVAGFLCPIRHLPSTAKHCFSFPVSSTGARSSTPSGSRPADHGRGQGRVPSLSLSWQTGSSHHSTVMPIDDSSDPWLEHTANCWPLEDHHYAMSFAVKASFKTCDPSRWTGLLSPRADALRENRGLCLNSHENKYCFKHCRHPLFTESGCLNAELGQLGDDDTHRR